MENTAITTTRPTARQRRLRAIAKRLVIELGYLEHCLAEGLTPSWSCHETNEASQRVAARVGFVRGSPYLWLALRPYERRPGRGLLLD